MKDQGERDETRATESSGWYSNEAATFGDRLSAAREQLGLSQADLARRLGVKLKTVEAWEDDRTEPRANRLQLLAGVLNVSLMWLLNGEGEGIAEPGDHDEVGPDVADLLGEMAEIRASLVQGTQRLGRLEKRLRRALREPA